MGKACLIMQILQNGESIPSRLASPSRVRRIYGLLPLPAAPDHCSLLRDLSFLTLSLKSVVFVAQTCY